MAIPEENRLPEIVMDLLESLSGELLNLAVILAAIYGGVVFLNSSRAFLNRLPLRWRQIMDRHSQTEHRKDVSHAGFAIRPFVDEDASAVVDLSAKLNRAMGHNLDRDKARTRLAPDARRQNGLNIFVAGHEDAIVGYAGVQIVAYGTYHQMAYLTELFVLPAYRRNGIATELLETVVAKAHEQTADFLRWHVQPGAEDALAFYRKFGAIWDPLPQLAVPVGTFFRTAIKKGAPLTDAPEWRREAFASASQTDLEHKPTE